MKAIKSDESTHNKDKGYATLELTLIMPLLILMIVLIIGLFIDTINDGASRAGSYEYLYTYNRKNEESAGTPDNPKFSQTIIGNADTSAGITASGGEVAVNLYHIERRVNGGYGAGSSAEYKTEYDKTTGRLRRWQLYGDYLWE